MGQNNTKGLPESEERRDEKHEKPVDVGKESVSIDDVLSDEDKKALDKPREIEE